MTRRRRTRSSTDKNAIGYGGYAIRKIGTITIVVAPNGHGRVYGTDKDRAALNEAMKHGADSDRSGALKGFLRGTGQM